MLVSEALTRYLTRCRLAKRRALPSIESRVKKHLGPYFGRREAALTEEDLVAYWLHRQEQGAQDGTVRVEIASLRRALRVSKVGVPAIPEDLGQSRPRQGFLELPDFERCAAELVPELRRPFRFAYVTGWRLRSSVFTLAKTDVDLDAGWVLLRRERSKNSEPVQFPLSCFGLDALVRDALAAPPAETPWLFHRYGGKPIREIADAWEGACRRAKVKRTVPHDFRRSAVRNLVNAGVDQTTAMQLTGHKTAEVFRRYRIVNEGDLRKAGERLAGYLSRTGSAG